MPKSKIHIRACYEAIRHFSKELKEYEKFHVDDSYIHNFKSQIQFIKDLLIMLNEYKDMRLEAEDPDGAFRNYIKEGDK